MKGKHDEGKVKERGKESKGEYNKERQKPEGGEHV
jgi:hypothetical protein